MSARSRSASSRLHPYDHQRSGARSNVRFALRAVTIITFVLGSGCSNSTAVRDVASDTSLSPRDRLAVLAAREAEQPAPIVTEALAEPPGVEAALLAPRSSDDPRARLSEAQALADIAARAPERTPRPPAEPLDADAQDEALRYYLRGRDAALRNQHLVAITELEKAREIDPRSVSILRELAHSYASLPVPNLSRMAGRFEDILRIRPDDSEALFTLGLTAANRRDFETAAEMLAAPRAAGRTFDHDPAAEALVDYTLHVALRTMGYDRASIAVGRRAADVEFSPGEGTIYGQILGALYRQRGDIWRAVGDAHCRLGEFDRALDAYRASAQLPVSDPDALTARVLFVNLRLGRPSAAQHELLAAFNQEGRPTGDRLVRLSEYIANHTTDHTLIAHALRARAEQHSDDANLARAAALLLTPEEGRRLLTAYVVRRPRETLVVGQLLDWLAQRDQEAAVEVTADLIRDHPDLTNEYVQRLVLVLPRPMDVLVGESNVTSPAVAEVHVNMYRALRGLGEAWHLCARAIERWPDDRGLRLLAVELAAVLDDLPRLERALADAEDLTDPWSWIVRARALRIIGEFGRAIEASVMAMSAAEHEDAFRMEASLEAANVHAAMAETMPIDAERSAEFDHAIRLAEEAAAHAPSSEAPAMLLARLYGPAASTSDTEALQRLIARLRRDCPSCRYPDQLAAQLALQQGRFEQALEVALSLFESDPIDSDSLLVALLAWQRMSRADDAARWMRTQLEVTPHSPVLLDQYVRLMIAMHRQDEALDEIESRRGAQPDNPFLRQLREMIADAAGDQETALALADTRLVARPISARREIERAGIRIRAEQPAEALAHLRWVLEHVDQATERQLMLATELCAGLSLETDEARTLTARLVDASTTKHERLPFVVYSVGLRAYAQLPNSDAAFTALVQRAATKSADAADASRRGLLMWREFAQQLVNMDRIDLAAQALRTRLSADVPYEEFVIDFLTKMTLQTYALLPDGAAKSIDLLLELTERGHAQVLFGPGEPLTLPELFLTVGNLFTMLGNDEGADVILREAIRHDPQHAMAMNNLGYARIERGRSDPQTITWIETAARLGSESDSILDTIAWLRYKQGRYTGDDSDPGALEYMERAIAASEAPSGELFLHQGDVLWRLDRRADAISAWRRALALFERIDRDAFVKSTEDRQRNAWGLLVVDPQIVYERNFERWMNELRARLNAAEVGEAPLLAPTFAEQGDQGDGS